MPTQRNRGFTIVELLLVVTIIGLLVALLMPAVSYTREAARQVQCRNNLHQIGVAINQYLDVKSVFPGYAGEDFPDAPASRHLNLRERGTSRWSHDACQPTRPGVLPT
jgi:prepilin-type N-terminal cleavage/methylation domain-containing protein